VEAPNAHEGAPEQGVHARRYTRGWWKMAPTGAPSRRATPSRKELPLD